MQLPRIDACQWRKFHAWSTLAWITLIPPSLLLWRESVPWLVFMSIWANVVGHASAYQASRAEEAQ